MSKKRFFDFFLFDFSTPSGPNFKKLRFFGACNSYVLYRLAPLPDLSDFPEVSS
ncbi:unnamed protein product [Meloidogyne enterolobii]|uniref:Uncharacterized protein n=1 Tax=Meloidogyne enterolobii TaxID=390850 RepID=A0ACB1A2K1_MELEN